MSAWPFGVTPPDSIGEFIAIAGQNGHPINLVSPSSTNRVVMLQAIQFGNQNPPHIVLSKEASRPDYSPSAVEVRYWCESLGIPKDIFGF